MSHFLENLVQRSFGQTAVIQPRPISRFESQEMSEPPGDFTETTTGVGPTMRAADGPERPLSASLAHHDLTRDDPSQEQTNTPGQFSHQTVNSSESVWHTLTARLDVLSESLATYRPSQPPTTPPIMREQPQTAGPTATPSQTPKPSGAFVGEKEAQQRHQNELSPQTANATLSERIIQVTQLAPSTTPAGRQASVSAGKPQAVDSEGTEVTGVNPWKQESAAKQIPTRPLLSPITTSDQSNTGKQPLLEPQPANSAAFAPQTSTTAEEAPIILRPKIAPFPPATGGSVRQKTEAETPPTINVTIGRIEVKATPPPPTPAPKPNKRPRSKPTAMSLDEYLRRRKGGSG